MTSPSSFRPVHSHPFTLEEAMLLEINILVAEVGRLQNSIIRLQETQVELRSYLEEEPEEGDEDGEIGLAISENETTIASQMERIELIKLALTNKVGKDALGHYGLGVDTSTSTGMSTSTGTATGTDMEGDTDTVSGDDGIVTAPEAGADTEDEGIHL